MKGSGGCCLPLIGVSDMEGLLHYAFKEGERKSGLLLSFVLLARMVVVLRADGGGVV